MSESTENQVPHPLTTDGWMPVDCEEHATVRHSQIADVQRAVSAAGAIARLLHNSLCEPDATGAQPLGRGMEIDLTDALLCLSDYAFDRIEDMGETAGQILEYQREQGGRHGQG